MLDEFYDRIKDYQPISNAKYVNDYQKIKELYSRYRNNPEKKREITRTLIEYDMFFLGYFVLNIKPLNHPWIIDRLHDVTYGAQSDTLEIWAREHFKSTIFTLIEPIQKKLRYGNDGSEIKHYQQFIIPNLKIDPSVPFDLTQGIFSFNRKIAVSFLSVIKTHLEENEVLHYMYPDLLFENPSSESKKWTEDFLLCKRKTTKKEYCFEAWGLVDKMPTGRHLNHRIYDDVVTKENVNTAHSNEKVCEQITMSENLGSNTLADQYNTTRFVGTYYRFDDAYVRLSGQKDGEGKPLYILRKFPATENGQWNGRPILLTQKRLDKLKQDPKSYATQQLLNPKFGKVSRFDADDLVVIEPHELPARLFYFMTVDAAGDETTAYRKDQSDDWAITLFGVRPYKDNIGLSDVYILKCELQPFAFENAMQAIVSMYCSQPKVHCLGVEKNAGQFIDIHVKNYLQRYGKYLKDKKNFEILKHGQKKKEVRIQNALAVPLVHQKIKVLSTVSEKVRNKMRDQLENFPKSSHDDFLDGCAYLYDLLISYNFPNETQSTTEVFKEMYKPLKKERKVLGWLVR